jgi:hypothetical protein
MSPKKRTGHVQRGIRRAFIVDPGRKWTTRALMREWCHILALYQGRRSHRERHNYARSIRRAAEQLGLVRVGRRWPDGIVWRRPEMGETP